ncbi:MAG TPA: alkaline phosphatase family protein [Polyangia bacterium]|nr:alkaline phosphatase family protein [Polyangia bacterium]
MRPSLYILAAGSALAISCQLPPTSKVDPGGVEPGPGASSGDGSTAAPSPTTSDGGTLAASERPDPMAARRAACAFKAGARVTETLPLSESERGAIPIRHVVVVMKENRSFDHLLGNLHASGQPEVEAIPSTFANLDEEGASVHPFALDTTCVNQDPGHQWAEMHRQVDDGAMDGFVFNGADSTGGDGHFVMGTYAATDLPFYYWLANTFALEDRHFPSVRSGTWPNRSFLLLGTADGVVCTFCGKIPKPTTPTLFDSLDRAGVTWGVFTDSNPFDGTLGWDEAHRGLHGFADFQRALRDGTLPAVAFVDSVGWVEDEHPTADVQVGENWTRLAYEAAVASPLWPSLAMIWTYDEAGGFADHVPPPNTACIARPGNPDDTGFFELGVRVPLAVISPYARPHHVSHVVEDHTSITRFIEAVFGLPALTARDANSPALLDMFDFQSPPALLHPPPAPLAGTGGCHGQLVLAPDEPSYVSALPMIIEIGFRGVAMPQETDRVGIFKYPRAATDVPSETNPIEPVAWSYIGGHGRTPGGAPTTGAVSIDATDLEPGATWPLAPGLWIVHYLPALADGANGHTPAASALLEVTP